MALQEKKQNIKIAYNDQQVIIITIIASFAIILIQLYFTDFATLKGNLGLAFTITEAATGIILSILFGINIGLLYYKLRLASNIDKKSGIATAIGGIFGVIVTGCPACSITLASYLGLASILAVLPFHGLEVKIIGILLLLYSTDSLLKNLTACTQSKPLPTSQ